MSGVFLCNTGTDSNIGKFHQSGPARVDDQSTCDYTL